MQNLPIDKLELTLLLRQHLNEMSFEGINLQGTLDAGLDFATVEDHLEDLEMLVFGYNSASRKVVFEPPPYRYFPDVETYALRTSCATMQHNKDFFIESHGYRSTSGDECPTDLAAVVAAGKLFKALEPLTDDVRKAGKKVDLVWMGKHKITLHNQGYAAGWKTSSELDDFISGFLEDERYRREKTSIVRGVLGEMFPNRQSLDMNDLMSAIGSFMQQVTAGYDLFVADFSFQRVKAAVDKEKLDFVMRLDQLLSVMQNQLLGVPLALVIVATQMTSGSDSFLRNITIFFGCIIYSLFMDILLRNQRATLCTLKIEVRRQHDNIRSITQEFDELFEDLKKRCKRLSCVLSCIDASVALIIIITLMMTLHYIQQ